MCCFSLSQCSVGVVSMSGTLRSYDHTSWHCHRNHFLCSGSYRTKVSMAFSASPSRTGTWVNDRQFCIAEYYIFMLTGSDNKVLPGRLVAYLRKTAMLYWKIDVELGTAMASLDHIQLVLVDSHSHGAAGLQKNIWLANWLDWFKFHYILEVHFLWGKHINIYQLEERPNSFFVIH